MYQKDFPQPQLYGSARPYFIDFLTLFDKKSYSCSDHKKPCIVSNDCYYSNCSNY